MGVWGRECGLVGLIRGYSRTNDPISMVNTS